MGDSNGFFDRHAKSWEARNYPPNVRRRLEELIPAFGIRKGERVLDVGTGPGILIPYLQKRVGPEGRICALDVSLEMVRTARMKKCRATDLVLHADVHSLPLGRHSQDRVICFAAFPHFVEPRSALMEMSRVLVPGGILVIAHLMSRRELAEHHKTHSAVARDVLPDSKEMQELFAGACLSMPDIVDVPGRYLAVGVKRVGQAPCERLISGV